MNKILSPSSINLFYQCPYAWKLRYIDKIKIERPIPDFFIIGRIVHGIIDKYYKQIEEYNDIETFIINLLYEYESKLDYHNFKVVEKCINNFIKFELLRLQNNITFIKSELRLKDDKFLGVIDAVYDNFAVDWKTSQYTITNDNYKIQAYIYLYLLNHANYNVKELIFIFLRNNKQVKYEYNSNVIDFVNNMYSEIIDLIENEKFIKKENKFCKYCDYVQYCSFSDLCYYASIFV